MRLEFHLEINIPESGGTVCVFLSSVWNFHSQWWFGVTKNAELFHDTNFSIALWFTVPTFFFCCCLTFLNSPLTCSTFAAQRGNEDWDPGRPRCSWPLTFYVKPDRSLIQLRWCCNWHRQWTQEGILQAPHVLIQTKHWSQTAFSMKLQQEESSSWHNIQKPGTPSTEGVTE